MALATRDTREEPGWLYVVNSKIRPDAEEAWNEWYSNVHLPEILECPGFFSAARYVTDEPDGRRSYIAVYEVAGPEVLETVEFAAARGWYEFADAVEFRARVFRRL
jgi:antibiotic biosynthesis monooxygenase (ABM) superfamily enzyme